MSLNLTLTEESEDGCAIRFDLIQTPTAITIECLNSLNIKEFYEKEDFNTDSFLEVPFFLTLANLDKEKSFEDLIKESNKRFLTKSQLFTLLSEYTYLNYKKELGDIVKVFTYPPPPAPAPGA